MNTTYRTPLPGSALDYFDARAAVEDIQPGAWDALPYTSRVLAENLVRRCDPALLTDAPAYVRELTSYSGFADQGWLAIRRGVGVVTGAGKRFPPDTAAWLQGSKLAFFALYAALLVALARRPRHDLAAGCLLAWLLFLTAYAGVSTHYLVWVVPFGLVAARRWTSAYSAAAALSMIAFYLTWFPGVLLGPHAPARLGPAPAAEPVWRFYLAALALSWLVNVAWLAREAKRLVNARTSPGTPSA